MKHVYIFTQEELYTGEKDKLEQQYLEQNYGDKSFLVFEHHTSEKTAFIGDEEGTGMFVAEY